MATEYTCITRKIEVHLHRHGDDEDAVQRYKNEFQIWNEINNNLYKVANFISSHLFFNDAFVDRLRVQSNEYRDLLDLISKTTDAKEIKALENRKKALDAEFKRQQKIFLKGGSEDEKGSEKTAIRRIAVEAFPNIPYSIINSLNDQISKTYNSSRFDVSI
jgi:hypothetical protein